MATKPTRPPAPALLEVTKDAAGVREFQRKLFAATEQLEAGGDLDEATREFVVSALECLSMVIRHEFNDAHVAPGRPRAVATWEAARVVQILVYEDGVSIDTAARCVLPDMDDASDVTLAAIKRAYNKIEKGEYSEGEAQQLVFPTGLLLVFVEQARARLPMSSHKTRNNPP